MALLRRIFCLFLWLCPVGLWADLSSETLYLTWQEAPDTTMTVQWMSLHIDVNDTIRYQRTTDTEWHIATGQHFDFSPSYFIHRVHIQDLQPDTFYRLQQAPNGPIYLFQTAPRELNQPIRFVVGGDMYHDHIDSMNQMSQEAAHTNPLFAVVGGDISYAVKRPTSLPHPERWIEWLKAWHTHMQTGEKRLIPVVAAIGNHDVAGHFRQTPAQAHMFRLLFPHQPDQTYATLNFGSYLSLFLLDSEHANSIVGSQTDWLKDELKKRQTQLYRFAIYHVPAYPSVRSYFNRYSSLIRRYWVPLFEEGHIQYAFEHHDHSYKRTYPLLRNRRHPRGIVYFGDGAWGIEKPRQAFLKRPYLASSMPIQHILLVTLKPQQTSVEMISHNGKILDRWYTHFFKTGQNVDID